MTDLEISKALALAIGWNPVRLMTDNGRLVCFVTERDKFDSLTWWHKPFDYRDWNVIGPIAERYDVFPYMNTGGSWTVPYRANPARCKTPQEAIALAVIGAKK